MLPFSTPRRRSVRRAATTLALGALVGGLIPTLALTTPAGAAADDAVWTPVAGRAPQTKDGNARAVNPTDYRAYRLDEAALARSLRNAPGEGSRGVSATTVSIPAPNGDLVEFAITESPVMEAGLAAAHPEIKSYAGTAVDSAATVRLDVSPQGFHASVLGAGAAWYVDPAFRHDDSLYLSYLGQDVPADEEQYAEPTLDRSVLADVQQRAGEAPGEVVSQRSYRLAFLTDPTYAEYNAPGTNTGSTEAASNAGVLAEKVRVMDRVNHVYTQDLGIRMLLIDETDRLNLNLTAEAYGANGPCGVTACFTTAQTANCTSATLTRNRLVVGQIIGADRFDIGHIGLGTPGGGIASLGVVGGGSKAQGCTGLPTPTGDLYAIDYVAHEMGHQFSGNHTFNSTVCTGNRNAGTSVEPGGGTSVMAYAGICGADDLQPHSDPYFSQRSQQEITTYTTSALANVSEVQQAALTGFATNGQSFTLSFPAFGTSPGGTTVPIVRGTATTGQQPYTAAGIKAAVEAVTGGTVTVSGAFGLAFGDAGFTLSFAGTLAGTDVPTPALTVVAGAPAFSGYVNAIAQGGPQTNGGQTVVPSGNRAPSVTAPASKFLPVRTPFTLTGSGEDVDSDPLLSRWDQTDRAAAAARARVSNTKTNGPLFRVFGTYANVTPAGTLTFNSPGENIATANPSRTFPDMAQVLAGTTNAATGACPVPVAADYVNGVVGNPLLPGPVLDCYSEFLPTAAYTGAAAAANDEPSINFRLTARDQDTVAGGTQFADTKLRLDRSAGPFLVTSQPTATEYAAGSSQTVTWAVNNTNKPSLATNVKISLSTDGGQTFDRVLAESTPNDGSADVTIPTVGTTTGRIKIEAVGNYFFDVNDAPITITRAFTVTDNVPDVVTAQYSDPVDISFSATTDFGDASTLTATQAGLPIGLGITKTVTQDGPPGSATFTITGNLEAGPYNSYPVEITVSDGVNSQVVDFSINVEKEVPEVTYTGPSTVSAPRGGDDAVDVTATASVVDTDGTTGFIQLATATFTDTTTGEVLCTDAPVTAAGTTSCTFGADLPATGSRDYAIAVTLGGDFYAGGTTTPGALTVTVQGLAVDEDVPDTVTAQYSDPVDVTFSASTGTGDSTALAATATGLPEGLTLTATGSDAGVRPGTATYTLTGNVTAAPGSYPVVVTVTDGTTSDTVDFTVEVAPEDAAVTYTGPTTATAPAGGDDATDLTVTASVVQDDDDTPGDLGLATATFTDTTTGDVLCADAPVTAAGTTTCTFDADLPAGGAGRTYAIDVELGGYYTGATEAPGVLTVSVAGLVVDDQVADTVSTQYSDPVAVSFSASTGRGDAGTITASASGLPEGLSLTRTGSDAGTVPGTATFTVTGNVTAAPGSYPVSVLVSDGTTGRPVDFTVVVTPEVATATYTGPASVTAPRSGDDAVPVNATAVVAQAADGTPGDLARATARFVDAATDEVLCAEVPVSASGLASCTFSADLPASGRRDYDVSVVVGGYFSGTTATPGDLTVAVAPDTTAPQTTITAGPANGSIVVDRAATVVVAASEVGSTFTCALDARAVPCAAGRADLRGLASGTHTFTAIAVDAGGNADASPAVVRWTVPRDDRTLVRTGAGWTRITGTGPFDGTLTQAASQGRILRTNVAGATTVAVVAPTGPTFGAVSVYLNGKLLGNRTLRTATAGGKKVLTPFRFATPVTGEVRIVTRGPKTVRIDGLAVVTG